MQRYNRNPIGLMEPCNTGEWVRHSEALLAIDKADEDYAILDNTCSSLRVKLEGTHGRLSSLQERYDMGLRENARLHALFNRQSRTQRRVLCALCFLYLATLAGSALILAGA